MHESAHVRGLAKIRPWRAAVSDTVQTHVIAQASLFQCTGIVFVDAYMEEGGKGRGKGGQGGTDETWHGSGKLLDPRGLGRRRLVDVELLLQHVRHVEADVGRDQVGPGGAEGSVAVEAKHGNALREDHRVRNDTVGELLHVVLLGLDEAELDPEIGAVNAQLVRRVGGQTPAAQDHAPLDERNRRKTLDGQEVQTEQLGKGDGLVDDGIALEVAVRDVVAVIVGGDVPAVVHEGCADEENLPSVCV